MTAVLVDTGPIVAFLNRSDTHHAWARAEFSRRAPPYLTCESVLSEASFLVGAQGGASALVLELVRRGALAVAFDLGAETEPVRRLMARYADIGVSLADACLVRLSELKPDCALMTIDRDFLVYRRDGRRTIPLIAPF